MTHELADDQGRHSPRNHAPGALRRHASRANLAGKRVQNRPLAVSPFDPLQRLVCIVRSGGPTRLPAGGEETGAPKENRFVREVGRNEGRDLGDHEIVKEGSQGSAQRHPWFVVTQIRRPLGCRLSPGRGRAILVFWSAPPGALRDPGLTSCIPSG